MATQMIVIIGLGAFAGLKLDEYFQTSGPYLTAAVSLFAVGFAMWYALKDFLVKKDWVVYSSYVSGF